MDKNWFLVSGKLTAVLTVTLAMNTIAFADDDDSMRFTNHTIQGIWGFSSGVGFIVSPNNDMPLPLVGAGTVMFDGEGYCRVSTTVNLNGTKIGPITSDSCTYSVKPDGTGTSIAYFSNPGTPESSAVSFVIVDYGKEIRFINTDALVGSFTAKRM